MASLSDISIKRPVLATVMSVIIVLFGVLGFTRLGVREFPSIEPPIITVKTTYTGANAEVIQTQITEPIEKAVNGIENVRSITSQNSQGSSTVTVEFNLNADLNIAFEDVSAKVQQAQRQLPADLDAPPVVTKADANSDAIIALTLQSDTKNQLQVNEFAETFVQERLQTIPGVSSVQIWGQKKYAMRIWIYPEKLAGYGLTSQDIQTALAKNNVELPTGKIQGNKTELTIRALGRFSQKSEFENLILYSKDNKVVKLSDVARVDLGAENEETVLKKNAVPMVATAIVPQPGANYLEIADEFYKRLEDIKRDLPSDYKVGIALDNTRFVKKSVEEVGETLLIALILVVLIIFLFFRDWLIALRPLIDIPVSLIGAFFIMYIFGFSINVLTLLAIVLATGLVVDDGIVVTENIFKKIEEGLSIRQAAIAGSNEIIFAVVSTSVTLAAVFLPIIFLEGFTGRLFREFGIVVASSVLISAFVSLTLTPMLNVVLTKKGNKRSNFYNSTEKYFVRLNSAYESGLGAFIKKKWLAIPIILVTVGIIFLIGKNIQSELAPLDDRSSLRILSTAQEGSSYEYMAEYTDRLTQFLLDSVPEASTVLSVTAPGFAGTGSVNTSFNRIVLVEPKDRNRSQQNIYDYINRKLRGFNEARSFVIQEQTLSGGGAAKSSLPVQYVIQNQSFDKLKEFIPKFLDAAGKDPTFNRTDVNLKFSKPEVVIEVDRPKIREMGLNMGDVAQSIQMALSGQRYGYFTIGDKQYQVIGQVDRADRDDPADLSKLYVRNNVGTLIKLDNVIKISERASPPQLYKYNRANAATVSADLAPGKTLGDGIAAMDRIKDQVLDETFTTTLTGSSRDYAESSNNILFAFLLALALIYLVLAAQFESFVDPFIIMLTVPLAIGGALISLYLTGNTLNIFSQIGIIVLIGLVTKNGILIVEFSNQMREKGMAKLPAVIHASVGRLRPILMTSLATVFGAVPIAFALGSGATSRIPLGVVIIGGMMFSLILTLFVIPAMYIFLSSNKKYKLETEHKIDTNGA